MDLTTDPRTGETTPTPDASLHYAAECRRLAQLPHDIAWIAAHSRAFYLTQARVALAGLRSLRRPTVGAALRGLES